MNLQAISGQHKTANQHKDCTHVHPARMLSCGIQQVGCGSWRRCTTAASWIFEACLAGTAMACSVCLVSKYSGITVCPQAACGHLRAQLTQYNCNAHLEMPKSAILALPCLSSSTFCGFRSLCTTAGCRYASPEAMSNPICRICGRKHDRHTAAAWQHDALCMQSSLQTATS